MGFRFLVLRECRRILRRSPATAAILFLVPLGYLLLFGDVYRAGSMAGIPLVILDPEYPRRIRPLLPVIENARDMRAHIFGSLNGVNKFIKIFAVGVRVCG